MKTILPLLFFLIHFVSFGGIKENWPQYKVICSELNTALNENEAEYFFYSPELQTLYYGMEVSYAVDDKIGTVILDKQGTFVIKTTPGKHVMQLYIPDHDEMYLDSIEVKAQHRTTIELYWRYTELQITVDKPVIYIYPEKEKESVTVQVEATGELCFVYPAMKEENKWDVLASPNGVILHNGDPYRYLFWEAKQENFIHIGSNSQGIYCTPENSTATLENICNAFGLNSFEKADLITYWGPKIQQMKNCFITILLNEEANQFGTLKIDPKPDHIYRLYLLFAENHESSGLQVPKIIPKIKREGFTVVEWGGTILPDMNHEKL
jgi:hypothetical protein